MSTQELSLTIVMAIMTGLTFRIAINFGIPILLVTVGLIRLLGRPKKYSWLVVGILASIIMFKVTQKYSYTHFLGFPGLEGLPSEFNNFQSVWIAQFPLVVVNFFLAYLLLRAKPAWPPQKFLGANFGFAVLLVLGPRVLNRAAFSPTRCTQIDIKERISCLSEAALQRKNPKICTTAEKPLQCLTELIYRMGRNGSPKLDCDTFPVLPDFGTLAISACKRYFGAFEDVKATCKQFQDKDRPLEYLASNCYATEPNWISPSTGNTPLMTVLKDPTVKDLEIIGVGYRYILISHPDVSVKDRDGNTVLHLTSDWRQIGDFIHKGQNVKINQQNNLGETPLLAFLKKATERNLEPESIVNGVEDMIKAGADPEIPDQGGMTAAKYAKYKNLYLTREELNKHRYSRGSL